MKVYYVCEKCDQVYTNKRQLENICNGCILSKALNDLSLEIIRILKIDVFVEWLNNKLK